MEITKTITVDPDSCGEELEQFVLWMNENHKTVEVIVEPTMNGTGGEYWEMYCNQ